ncbi:MAG: SH3 domain-containing protein [Saccharofermentanales bacterium]
MKSNPYKGKRYNIKLKKIRKEKSRPRLRLPKIKIKDLYTSAIRKRSRIKTESYYDKEVYVGSGGRRQYPAWLLPLIIVIGISLVVFWMGPLILNTITKVLSHPDDKDKNENLLYASSEYAVVAVQTADLFDKPDLKASRETQILYNQVVKIIDRSVYGFYKVILDDGTTGYVMSGDVASYTSCAEPSLFKYKVVVISKSKKIMTHSSNGSTIIEIMMGTVMYSNYQGEDVYKVSLPDKSEGWISANGVLKINSTDEIKKSNAKSFYTTVLSFNDTTFINQGLTRNGASSDGIAYIAAKVNGIVIPRDKQKQSKTGTEIKVNIDKTTGLINYDDFLAGDLIFFKSTRNPGEVGESGIIIGYGQVLMSRSTSASVKIIDINKDPNLISSILTVRRIF